MKTQNTNSISIPGGFTFEDRVSPTRKAIFEKAISNKKSIGIDYIPLAVGFQIIHGLKLCYVCSVATAGQVPSRNLFAAVYVHYDAAPGIAPTIRLEKIEHWNPETIFFNEEDIYGTEKTN